MIVCTGKTAPAWGWLNERYVPVETTELSTGTPKPPDSDAKREQNDSDQCSECRCPPGQPHNPECDVSCSPDISCDRKHDAPGTPTVDFYTSAAVAGIDVGPDSDGEPARSAHETPTNLPVGARSAHPDGVDIIEEPAVETHEDLQGKDADRMADTITDNCLLDSMERTFTSCLDIAAAKNHDYAADVDPFRNFRECGRFGVGIDSGILVRMSDKWSRLCQLAKPGETAAVSDETLVDTVLDLINYAAILVAVYEDEA